ncbi:hypothetical protein OQJ19_03510 [Fluoribacter gormanii]|uniref:hypothetical protein n=1 Tax=Fluoribacter gormanii TaxID=464 RepID=UPI0022449183|nr:hypothetical protein [Fluoribacter gormanii]MCW8469725.1 hypothetical protein [Fluoribacter gormanii]
MRNTDQQNQNPFDKLANEMLLAILNTRNKDKNYILNPKDILSFALSCQRFNGISLDANCFFSPHKYNDVRQKASDYHEYKERRLAQLKYAQRVWHEKNGAFYLNKTNRNRMATCLGLLLASILAFTFDMGYGAYFVTTLVLSILALVINDLLFEHLEYSLNSSDVSAIPLQFFEEEIVGKSNSI